MGDKMLSLRMSKGWAGTRLVPVMLVLVMVAVVGGGAQGRAARAEDVGSRTFPETGKTVSGAFLAYWDGHGGLAQQGYPISEEIQEKSDTDGKIYTVQYFERAVFESHPENAAPYDVLLALLGTFRYAEKYPSGAPDQTASNAADAEVFPATGKHLGGIFLEYWKANGGLAQQGYPISDEFLETSPTDGKTYMVQYFERAVFESHPINKAPNFVLLSLLGTFRYAEKYPSRGPGAGEVDIAIMDFSFVPEAVTVPVGTRIKWANMDASEHKVANVDHTLFNSPYLHTGESFSYTVTGAGTIEYMCTLHPTMRGTIVVK
jgi:plastocyanin